MVSSCRSRAASPHANPRELAAQSAYADSGADPEMLAIYHLLGDPALKIK